MNAALVGFSGNRRSDTLLWFGRSWAALAGALALHVCDEALTDFLSVYNPAVLTLRGRVPWLPLPTFSFGVWIAGLALGIALLFLLSPLAFLGSKWIVRVALPLSVIMIGNGLGHIGASLYMKRLMPGVYSSPVLIAASVCLLVYAMVLLKDRKKAARKPPFGI